MHQSMHSGSVARVASAFPMSAVSNHKLIEDAAHHSLCGYVVPANKHGGLAVLELRIDHAGVAD